MLHNVTFFAEGNGMNKVLGFLSRHVIDIRWNTRKAGYHLWVTNGGFIFWLILVALALWAV